MLSFLIVSVEQWLQSDLLIYSSLSSFLLFNVTKHLRLNSQTLKQPLYKRLLSKNQSMWVDIYMITPMLTSQERVKYNACRTCNIM